MRLLTDEKSNFVKLSVLITADFPKLKFCNIHVNNKVLLSRKKHYLLAVNLRLPS